MHSNLISLGLVPAGNPITVNLTDLAVGLPWRPAPSRNTTDGACPCDWSFAPAGSCGWVSSSSSSSSSSSTSTGVVGAGAAAGLLLLRPQADEVKAPRAKSSKRH
ncbi:MAG: hypothetical protein FJ146_13890 [Deltaproteobacteria bacterium]|nr:hypothetical protein [Deltaproteobacteria bacterium]